MSERVTVAARKAGGVERVTVMWRRGQRVTVAARKQGSGQYVVATLRSGGSQGRRAFKGVTVAARKQGVTVAARKKQGSGWAVDRGRKGHCGLAARKAGGRSKGSLWRLASKGSLWRLARSRAAGGPWTEVERVTVVWRLARQEGVRCGGGPGPAAPHTKANVLNKNFSRALLTLCDVQHPCTRQRW